VHPHRGPFPISFAHRGGAGPARENSIPAFQAALQAGARGLESDTWLTADGTPVLDHDGQVDGTAIGLVKRADLPEHIPSIDELYDECGTDFDLSLDVIDTRAITPVIEAARARSAVDRLWVVAPWGSVRAWRSVDPDVHIICNVPVARIGPGFASGMKAIRAAGVCGINLPYTWWNPLWVWRVHNAGLLAFGWHAHKAWQISYLHRIGCDGIYSDTVAELVKAHETRMLGR
jgi:glycerophosphoryl diester phosphodiesterase